MSICPSAGKTTVDTTTNAPYAWKLPPNTGDGSYTNLFLTKAGLVTATSGTNATSFVNTIQAEPYGFVLSALYYSTPSGQGRYGVFWARSSNKSDGNNSYDFHFYRADDAQYYGVFNLQSARNKYIGRAVRCVLWHETYKDYGVDLLYN